MHDVVKDLLEFSIVPPNLNVLSRKNQFSLFQLLISGYYFRDPLSPAGPGALPTGVPSLLQSRKTNASYRADCITEFVSCLTLISGDGFVNGKHTNQFDPIHGTDVKGNSVMHYLQKLHGLSCDFPHDCLIPYMQRNFILRDLFLVLQDIVTTRENFRVQSLMTYNLHSKEWERPVPDDIRRRLIRESKSGDSEEYFLRCEQVQMYRDHVKQLHLERMEHDRISLGLNDQSPQLPIPPILYTRMQAPFIDSFRVHRDHALRAYAAIQDE
jgi:hypothetical protein